MTKLEELEEQRVIANKQRVQLLTKRREKEYELNQGVQTTLDAEFMEPIREATQALSAADAALKAERDRIAMESAKPCFPVGTKVQKWSNSRFRSDLWVRSESDIGIVEVITPESEHPATTTYGRASVGVVVVRKIKKDGTPSRSYITVNTGWSGGWQYWRPIDVDYNAEVNAQATNKKKAEEQAFADAAKEVFGL